MKIGGRRILGKWDGVGWNDLINVAIWIRAVFL
jgi:hypothetical protein